MYETVSGKFYVFLPPSKNFKREKHSLLLYLFVWLWFILLVLKMQQKN